MKARGRKIVVNFPTSSFILHPSAFILQGVLVEQPGVLACLSRRRSRVQIPSRALAMIAARYANRQSGQAQTLVMAGSPPACATPETCAGWASASPTACDHRFAAVPEPARKAMQVQLLPGALTTWPARLSAT